MRKKKHSPKVVARELHVRWNSRVVFACLQVTYGVKFVNVFPVLCFRSSLSCLGNKLLICAKLIYHSVTLSTDQKELT